MGKQSQIILAKDDVKVLGKKVAIGSAIGVEQLVFEKIDEARGVTEDSVLAVQNVAPLIQTALASGVMLMTKSNSIRVLMGDVVSSGSAIMTYRIAKLAAPRVSGMFRKTLGNKVSNKGIHTHVPRSDSLSSTSLGFQGF